MAYLPKHVQKEICEIVDSYHSGGETRKARIVMFMDRTLELLLAHNGAMTKQMKSKHVGVHPDNRDKEGLQPTRAARSTAKIVDVGFSWKVASLTA